MAMAQGYGGICRSFDTSLDNRSSCSFARVIIFAQSYSADEIINPLFYGVMTMIAVVFDGNV